MRSNSTSNSACTIIRGESALRFRAMLLGVAASALIAGAAMAQDATSATNERTAKSRHHHQRIVANDSDRVELLERRLEQQQQEIDDLKAQVASGQGNVSPAQFEALQNQVYETQATVKEAAAPHDKKMHFKGVTFALGGFVALESVWRSNNLESDIGSPGFSKIPFAGPGSGNPTAVGGTSGSAGVGNATNIAHTREFRFSARQSRVSGLAEADDGDLHLSGYGEFDFLGAAASANSNESNSYTPRVRNLYGTVEWKDLGFKFLFGQSWSLATLDTKGIAERSEASPPTIDAQYVVGFVWTRQPQLRVVEDFGDELWLGLSVENPQTTISGTAPSVTAAGTGVTVISNNGNSFSGAGLNGTADAEFNPGIQLSLNHVPDVIGKIAWEPGFFDGNVHLEAVGIYRDFYDRTINSPGGVLDLTTATNNNVSGGGGGIAGLIKVFPGLFDIQFDSLYGTGIGRYGSGQLPDATYSADGVLRPINENMEMVGLTLHATPDFDVYVFGGRESEAHAFFTSNGNGGYGNSHFNNTGCFNFNLTATCTGNVQTVEQITGGLWDKVYNGDFGNFRVGLQYSYTWLKAFDGVGGAPHTHDNMIFTSFRYYPF